MIALIFSAFFSGSETAFITANRIKIEVWVKQEMRGALSATEFFRHPERFLTTTLVGNNIALVAASSIMAVYLEHILSGFAITLVTSAFLLFFAEILPKSIARDKPNRITVLSVLVLQFFYILFYPFVWIVLHISQLVLSLFRLKGESVRRFFTRSDLEMLVREGESAGLVDEDESSLISRVILRGTQLVRDIMIPRTDVSSLTIDDPPKTAADVFEKTGYSRLPVIGESIDEVLGFITAKDIILKKPRSLKSILRDVHFVPEFRAVGDVLKDFQEKNLGIAVVVDEYGGMAGLVTLEDIIEEFFGDIQDEHDEEANMYKKIAPHQIDVNARVEIDELNKRFGLNIPEGDYQTLSGFLLDISGRIPKRGERIKTEECTYLILSAYRKKLNWVRILKE